MDQTAEFKLYNTVVGQEYALVITRDFAEKHPECMQIINRIIECEVRLDNNNKYLESLKLPE